MRIVIGHTSFDGFGGTETYMLTIARELQSLGHSVTIYGAERLGEIAAVAREDQIPTADAHSGLPEHCEAVISNDVSSAAELAARYPEAAKAMVVHSDYFPLQSPPQLDGVCDVLIALNDRVARHIESLAFHAPVIRLRQPVDMLRFASRGPAPATARRALVLGNYLEGDAAAKVADACAKAELEAVFVGVHGEPTPAPERAIADSDLVIGLGRCIVEAMAGRRAAYVFGIAGGDGWVTPENYLRLEADGFGGGATGEVITLARLSRELAGWNGEMGEANRQLAMANHDAAKHARSLVELLRDNGATAGPPSDSAAEVARLARLEWRAWGRWFDALRENRELRQEIWRLRAELDDERRRHSELLATRRYRFAALLAAPLDAVKRRFRR